MTYQRNTFLIFVGALLLYPALAYSQISFRKGDHQCLPLTAVDKAFLEAVKQNDAALVGRLLRQGANSNTKDDCGISALTYSVALKHVDILKQLIAAGAEINPIDDFYHEPPLLWALRSIDEDKSGAYEIIKTLLSAGADANVKAESGNTPLIIAVVEESEGIVALLLEKGVEIDARDGQRRTAYSHAAETGNLKLKKMLLSAGANPRIDFEDYVRRYGKNAFIQATADGRTDVVEAMLLGGTDVNSANEAGVGALMRVCRESTFELLMNAGADVNKQDNAGFTALIWATYFGRVEHVKRLIAAGAEVNAEIYDGKTALDLAKEEEVKAILRAAGARHGRGRRRV